MANPFIAEVRLFTGNFAPTGWALCNGQLMSISQNTALFSLLGTTYGGDGRTTFALPNFQGSAPLQQGQGAGLSPRVLGETGGETAVTLLQTEMPSHTHGWQSSPAGRFGGDSNAPSPTTSLSSGGANDSIYASSGQGAQMSAQSLSIAGGNQPHNNMMPYLGLTFIIALQGIFPPRS